MTVFLLNVNQIESKGKLSPRSNSSQFEKIQKPISVRVLQYREITWDKNIRETGVSRHNGRPS